MGLEFLQTFVKKKRPTPLAKGDSLEIGYFAEIKIFTGRNN